MVTNDLTQTIVAAWQAMSLLEAVAVAMGVLYLVLAVRENILCWYAALVSTTLSIYIFWGVGLLMESALNIYYVGMAVYGWYQWKSGGGPSDGLTVTSWPLRRHAAIIAAIVTVSWTSGYLLQQNTGAAWPYLDSFTTWASVVTTFMVARKVIENWFYWFVIDAVSLFLYLDRGLYLYALLFLVYLVIVIFGYLGWRSSMRAKDGDVATKALPQT